MRNLLLFAFLLAPLAHAETLTTNAVVMHDAPDWITENLIDRVVDRIQNILEWDIRRIQAYWYSSEQEFEKIHGLGPSVLAFARRSDNTVHVGPRVTSADFETVFGHELVHVILRQKYKDAIPAWLEEGLANYASKHGSVDYRWLAAQPSHQAERMTHPFHSEGGVTYHYQASTALIEMIAARCDLAELLQLSVGKKLETYLSTFCGIKDVNAEFRKWIKAKAARKPA